MKLVNRIAVLVKPKQPFLNWAMKVQTEDSEDEVREALCGRMVYLIEPGDAEEVDNSAADEQLRRIFAAELASWHDDETDWPDLSSTLFDEWFDAELQAMVIDLEHETLVLGYLSGEVRSE